MRKYKLFFTVSQCLENSSSKHISILLMLPNQIACLQTIQLSQMMCPSFALIAHKTTVKLSLVAPNYPYLLD